jgi:hypothetical protein
VQLLEDAESIMRLPHLDRVGSQRAIRWIERMAVTAFALLGAASA